MEKSPPVGRGKKACGPIFGSIAAGCSAQTFHIYATYNELVIVTLYKEYIRIA
jgi:hypothetical protein